MRATPKNWFRSALLLGAMLLLLTGCGSSDPGVLGPNSVGSGLSAEGQKQEYVDGVSRALQQLKSAQGADFSQAVDGGKKQQLQTAALAWKQGGQQLKQLSPPKEAAAAHAKLVKAVDGLAVWNNRLVAAAPNKARTRSMFKKAAASPASSQYANALCELEAAGFSVLEDAAACSPLADAGAPSQ